MSMVVGIDRKIRRVWLDDLVDRLVTGADITELRAFLHEYLQADLPGKASRSNTVGILLRIWSGVPSVRSTLRNQALALVPAIAGRERLWLHWGMTCRTYPFFRDSVQVVGRLLALQGDLTTAQVQARMLGTWGDRETIREAVQKLTHTLVDWGVILATETKGHFVAAPKLSTGITDLQLWLLEAMLEASAVNEIDAQQLLRLPELFPFALTVGMSALMKHPGFNVDRQGLDMDVVSASRGASARTSPVGLDARLVLPEVPVPSSTGSTRGPRKPVVAETSGQTLFDLERPPHDKSI